MTREGCVRADAMRGFAAVSLLTAIACAGCGRTSKGPAHAEPPPAPAAVARVATLRVGVPAPGRGNLLFVCDATPAAPRIGSATYAPDSLDPSGRRWRRVPHATATDSAGALAPDTLLVRAFADATDEEIAFERGELDAAVFWPGELSARMRSDARFRDLELGARTRGVLACVGAGDTLGAPRADMEVLNREAFGGDLLPWSEPGVTPTAAPPARYVVDPTLPGARHLERILARIPGTGAGRTLKLVFLDQPIVAGDTAPAWRTPGVTPLFVLACPVLVRPEARNDVRAIGAGAIAELAPCAAGPQR